MLKTINKANNFDIHWTVPNIIIFSTFYELYLLLFFYMLSFICFYLCIIFMVSVFSFFLWAKSHYVGLLWLWLLLLVLLLLFALTKQILWPLSKLVKNCGSLIIVILWLSLS